MTATQWQGCYEDHWRGLIVPEAFAHPAKAARGLIRRIFDYLLSSGRLRPGDTVVDPFGGIGTTAIEGASRGVRVVCCELEPKFVALAERNFALHRGTWEAAGDPLPVIIQGDSRHLRRVIAEANCIVSSPPYAESFNGNQSTPEDTAAAMRRRGATEEAIAKACTPGSHTGSLGYGTTPGQLGALPAGSVDAVVSSPPYASVAPEANGTGPDRAKQYETYRKSGGGASFEAFCATQDKHSQGYGSAPGQLGALPAGDVSAVIASPPFCEAQSGGGIAITGTPAMQGTGGGPSGTGGYRSDQQGNSPGQDYGDTDGNIGTQTGQTFWQAAADIVRESYAILRPGGCAVWIVKNFVRNGAIVDFCGDWLKLCLSCGFRHVETIHASLVKLHVEDSLFGGKEVKTTARKSFFRRLHERKRPDLAIDYEVVLVLEKPGGGDGPAACVVSSPPFMENGVQSGGGGKVARNRQVVANRDAKIRPGEMPEQFTYGETPGQLGAMPPGSIDDAISLDAEKDG